MMWRRRSRWSIGVALALACAAGPASAAQAADGNGAGADPADAETAPAVDRTDAAPAAVDTAAAPEARPVEPHPAVDTSGTPPAPPRVPQPPSSRVLTADKRPLPDYSGRPAPAPTARDAFLWGPRALLFPVHLTAEYGVRRPLVGFVRWADEHYVFKRVYDLFTWNNGKSGVYPIASYDLGLKSTVGAAVVDGGFLVPESTLHAAVSASTQDVLSVNAQDRLRVLRDSTGAVYFGGGYVHRPDGTFYGIGPDTRTDGKTFYSFWTAGGTVGLAGNLGGLHQAVFEVGYRDIRIGGSDISATTPSVDARYGGPGQASLPAGWGGYDLAWSRALLVLDSRDPSFEASGNGVRFDTGASYGFSPRDPDLQLLSWQLEAGGFYDLSGARHVVAVEVAAHFVAQLGARSIPFTELPTLGGNEWMRGFLAGRLRGPSTLVTTLQYRYPVAAFVEGDLFAAVGNAFGEHLAGFAPERLFLNWGMELRTTFVRDVAIALTVAFASNRLDSQDFDAVDVRRISVGVIHGF